MARKKKKSIYIIVKKVYCYHLGQLLLLVFFKFEAMSLPVSKMCKIQKKYKAVKKNFTKQKNVIKNCAL